MDRAAFAELVSKALDGLPDAVLGWLDNVAINGHHLGLDGAEVRAAGV